MSRNLGKVASVFAVSVAIVSGAAITSTAPAQAAPTTKNSAGFSISAPGKVAFGDVFKIKCKAAKSLQGMTAGVYENGVAGVIRTVNERGNCTMKVRANTEGSRKFWVILSQGGAAATSNKVIVKVG